MDRPRAATDDDTDLALVRAVQRGEKDALAPLLERYQDRLFGVCVRMVGDRDLAADLTQDAMIKAIEGISTFDERAKFSTWVIRVTMNVCLSKLRSERLRRHASLEQLAAGTGQRPSDRPSVPSALIDRDREHAGAESVELEDFRRRVSAALLRVAPEQRAILVLRDSRGLDYEQIAEALGVPVGTVKSRLFRARAALREAMEEDESRGPRAPESAL